jgi:hypothetical protein
METKQKGIGVKLTLITKCFHKWKKSCSPCGYITPKFLKVFLVVHYVVCKDLRQKLVMVMLITPTLFFAIYRM